MHTHWNRLLTLCVLACCLFAVGSAAASLDDAVSSDPGDTVDPDWEELPVGSEEAERLKERWQPTEADGEPTASGTTDGEGETDESMASSGESEEASGDAAQSGSAGGGGTDGAAGGSDARATGSASNRGEDSGGVSVSERSLLDVLFELLRVFAVVLLLAGLIVGGVVLLRRLWPDDPDDGTVRVADSDVGVGPTEPSNEVSRAWFELMARFDLADAHHLTPAERAQAAVERGADPNAVRPLTDLFERTRYGAAPVTEERSRRARRWLDQAVASTTTRSTSPDRGVREGRL
ncbi:DUF4129 domain-containing protein [Salinigranum sp.]|uniref:DUF4129 domain-containing protein n=1 Tax=Salinigranum sp. TaxID=1966351 RepID=UPI003562272F